VINASVRSGCVAANRKHKAPPSSSPYRIPRSEPAASITARMSSILASSVGRCSPLTLSESPVPLRSKSINRPRAARPRSKEAWTGHSQTRSTFEMYELFTNTMSGGPEPVTW
jgi:hypothetical protein